MRCSIARRCPLLPLLIGTLPARVLASNNVLTTDGFSFCTQDPTVNVTQMDINYNRATQKVAFAVAGWSSEVQNVSASIIVTAYGKTVYTRSFDPCENDALIGRLCPGTPPVKPNYPKL